jgi:hypothetical protein
LYLRYGAGSSTDTMRVFSSSGVIGSVTTPRSLPLRIGTDDEELNAQLLRTCAARRHILWGDLKNPLTCADAASVGEDPHVNRGSTHSKSEAISAPSCDGSAAQPGPGMCPSCCIIVGTSKSP